MTFCNWSLGKLVAASATKLVGVVDDDELVLNALQRLLKAAGYCVATFASGEDSLKLGQLEQTACLIVEIRMPGISGLDRQRRLRTEHPVPSALSPALDGISFRVARAETIAFVGPSGAGKTSLVKLLVGLYRPKSGHIFYNGTPEDQVAIEGRC
jgi:ATP-binding cassette subfamily B protein